MRLYAKLIGLIGGPPIAIVMAVYLIDPGLPKRLGGFLNPVHQPDPWPSEPQVVVKLPGSYGRMLFFRRSTHMFQAEYDRRVVIVRSDGQRFRRDLHDNTGGRTFVRLYWYDRGSPEGPYLRLEDHHGSTVISIRHRWAQRLVTFQGHKAFVRTKGDFGVEICTDKYGKKLGCGIDARKDGLEYVRRRVPSTILNGTGLLLGAIDGREGPPAFVAAPR